MKKDLLNCLKLVEYIIETCTDVYPHIYNMYREDGSGPFLYEDEYAEAMDDG